MGILYRFRTIPPGNLRMQEPGRVIYYPDAVSRGTVGLSELAEAIAQKTAFSEADVYGLCLSLSNEVLAALSSGYEVDVGPLGHFSIRLGATVPPVDPARFQPTQLRVKEVVFRPEKGFRKRLSVAPFVLCAKKEPIPMPDAEEREARILKHLRLQGQVSGSICSRLNGVSDSTTRRDLMRLIERGLLRKFIVGNFTLYALP